MAASPKIITRVINDSSDVRRLLEVAVLGAGRDAAQLVGRVGLVAVLVEPERSGVDVPRRRRERCRRSSRRSILQAAEVGVVRVRVGLARRVARASAGGRRCRRRTRAGTAAAAGADRAQLRRSSRGRAGTRAGACSRCRSQVAAGRRERADEDGATGSTAWIAGYAARTIARYTSGETGVQRCLPQSACGWIHSGRFGSFQRMYWSTRPRSAAATAEAKFANAGALGR